MSYILEALKKAQAERQLGNSPTIHAPTLHGADPSATGARVKKPLKLVLLAMGAVIVVLLALVLRPAATPPSTQLAAASTVTPSGATPGQLAVAAQSGAIAPVSSTGLPSAPAAVAAAATAAAPAPLPASLPAPLAALPPPVATITPSRVSSPPAALAAAPVTAPANTPATAVAPAKPTSVEESLMNLRDLPEPIQRSVPQIAMGGYIYSKNPADRLLLIDKVLRHEGEEVAPGLTLEKLQPKEAVFNFKGYRYRVPY